MLTVSDKFEVAMKMTARCETLLDKVLLQIPDNNFLSHEQIVAYIRNLIQEIYDEGYNQGERDTRADY